MTQEERNAKLWEAACAALTGLRAANTRDGHMTAGSSFIASCAFSDAAALVAEYERRTEGKQ